MESKIRNGLVKSSDRRLTKETYYYEVNGPNEHTLQTPKRNFTNINMMNVKANGTHFSDIDFTGANMMNMKARGAHFTNVKLTGASLTNADLRDAEFHNVDFSLTKLAGADFRGAVFTGKIIGLYKDKRNKNIREY